MPGGAFGRFIQRKLGAFDIWLDPFHKVKQALLSGIAICDKWVTSCEKLTEQFWKRDPMHPWNGAKFTPEGVSQLSKRLQEVSEAFLFGVFISKCLILKNY